LTISNHSFTVRFAPETQKAEQVAEKICTEKGEEIGVTGETYNNCVNNVGEYLKAQVDNWADEKTVTFPVTLDTTQFSVRFIPELSDPVVVATNICTKYAEKSETPFDHDSCVKQTASYIQSRVSNFFDEKTLSLSLRLKDDLTVNARFLPERQSPQDVATQICRQYAEPLQLTNENVRNTCLVPVTNYLADAVENWARSKTLEFVLTIEGNPYTVSFMPERTSALTVAQEFCRTNAEKFQLTQENWMGKCVQPVSQRITSTIQTWVDSKKLVVPLQVGEKPINVEFIPERQSVRDVAMQFCQSQQEPMGLTTANWIQQCVNPTIGLLNQGLDNWVAQRRQQLQQQQQQAAAGASQPAAATTTEPAVAAAEASIAAMTGN
jgi:hypothetical protein